MNYNLTITKTKVDRELPPGLDPERDAEWLVNDDADACVVCVCFFR